MVVSTHLKNINRIGNLPQIGVKIKKKLKPPPRQTFQMILLRKAPKNSCLHQKNIYFKLKPRTKLSPLSRRIKELKLADKLQRVLKYQSLKNAPPCSFKKKTWVNILGSHLSTSIYKSSLWMRNTLYVASIFGKHLSSHQVISRIPPPSPRVRTGPKQGIPYCPEWPIFRWLRTTWTRWKSTENLLALRTLTWIYPSKRDDDWCIPCFFFKRNMSCLQSKCLISTNDFFLCWQRNMEHWASANKNHVQEFNHESCFFFAAGFVTALPRMPVTTRTIRFFSRGSL